MHRYDAQIAAKESGTGNGGMGDFDDEKRKLYKPQCRRK
jgi:hypothetical protein